MSFTEICRKEMYGQCRIRQMDTAGRQVIFYNTSEILNERKKNFTE